MGRGSRRQNKRPPRCYDGGAEGSIARVNEMNLQIEYSPPRRHEEKLRVSRASMIVNVRLAETYYPDDITTDVSM
jgi:hypothetical protein